MTPLQQNCLTAIRVLLGHDQRYAGGWLHPSYVMAHIEIESGWNPDAVSADGLGSIGLMQVLPSTCAAVGMGAGWDQRVPANSIEAGMRYLAFCRHALDLHFGAGSVSYETIAEAYNEGIGNAIRGRPDSAYVVRWNGAQRKWAFADAAAT